MQCVSLMPRSNRNRGGRRGGGRRGGRRNRNGRGQGRDFQPRLGGQPMREISSFPRTVQPIANSFRVTLTHTILGFIAAGTAGSNYGWALNNLVAPAGLKGGAANTLPNNTGGECAGLLNYLQNTSTGTGFYTKAVVLGSRVQVAFAPGDTSTAAGTDVLNVCLTVVAGTNTYASIASAIDGPNSVLKLIEPGQNRGTNTLAMSVNSRLVDGYSPAIWKVAGGFTYVTAPTSMTFCQLWWTSGDAAALTTSCPYQIRMEHDVEFFQRTDTTLED